MSLTAYGSSLYLHFILVANVLHNNFAVKAPFPLLKRIEEIEMYLKALLQILQVCPQHVAQHVLDRLPKI